MNLDESTLKGYKFLETLIDKELAGILNLRIKLIEQSDFSMLLIFWMSLSVRMDW